MLHFNAKRVILVDGTIDEGISSDVTRLSDQRFHTVFIRLGYGKAKLFANVDAGYAIGILGYDTENRDLLINQSTSKRVYPYDGLFFERHFGWRFGQRSALALGVLLQQSTILNLYERKDVIAGKEETVFYGKDTNSFSPAITLRYVVGF